MLVSFVADVHGNVEALALAAQQAEQLVVLGDLLDYVDYHDPAGGILGAVFGPQRVARFIHLRLTGDFAGLHAYNSELWGSLADPAGTVDEAVRDRYQRTVRALSKASRPPLVILGNVDVPDVWREVAGDTLAWVDGDVVPLAGYRFGFVGGGVARHRPAAAALPVLQTARRPWRPYFRDPAEFAAAVAGLGDVDVLCSHIPPDIAALRYDVRPGRLEMCGPGLLEAVDEGQPRYALFGHVHQPLAARRRRGRTECINVGHFARHGSPVVLDLSS